MVSGDALLAMKNMSVDPLKRSLLIKDTTCLGGLVLVLSNSDTEIVKLSLETLMLLSDTPDHKRKLRDFIGMMDQVDILRNKHENQCIRQLSEKLYRLLMSHDLPTPLKDCGNTSTHSNMNTSKRLSQGHGHHSCKSKTVILQLRGLINRCDRDVCMRLLLQVKGVISITFDLNKKRSILRVKPDVRPESLVHAIAKTQSIYAQQVIKNESGEELLLSFGSKPIDMDKENGPDLPDYLPDDIDSPVVDDKALARNKGDTEKGTGWLSTAASFFTNSFYW